MKYDDIINLPHYHDASRDYMSMHDRAAQFAPYKSLVGYEELINDKTGEVLSLGDEVIDYSESQEEYSD